MTRAAVSTSGERNVVVDAKTVSSSITAADKENNKKGGRCGRCAPVPLVVLEGRGGGAGPVVVTGQARGTTLQGVLAAPSVVVIARIIIKCVN